MDEIVPTSYASWRHCIEVSCGMRLTAPWIEQRIAALEDPKDHHTARFVELWGDDHHAQVLAWFRQARAELGP